MTRHRCAVDRISGPVAIDGADVYEVRLTRAGTAYVDPADLDLAKSCCWYLSSAGYAASNLGYMHRLILDAPRGVEVDHINGNPLDNRRQNLRLANRQLNCRNLHKPPSSQSGARCVWYRRDQSANRWQVVMKVGNRRKSFGCYPTLEEANAVASAAREKLIAQAAQLEPQP